MIEIELNEHSAEDVKEIEELRAMGVPEDVIQMGYNNTQEKRKKQTERVDMSREILFKAKRIDNGEWVEGNYLKYIKPNIGEIEHRIFISDGYGITWYTVHEGTICQYTGLKDKHGNMIWENDVVKYHFGNDVAPIRFGKYMSCFDSTKTAHVGFYVDWDDRTKPLRKDLGYWVNMIDCNVIGNIVDNPELLEGGE